MIVIARLIILFAAVALTAAVGAEEITLSVMPIGGGPILPATLIKPEGVGPFPAVVILHDCSGLAPRSSGAPRRWAEELLPQGYVVPIPDSFTPRGFPDGVCTGGRETQGANGYARAADAYGALAALRKLAYVDGKRIGVMGGSHGGWTILASLIQPVQDGPLVEAKRNGFTAAIALYPRCDNPYGAWKVTRANGDRGPVTGYGGVYRTVSPLLILSGELDDWTPARHCQVMVETARAAGQALEIKVYPGAHHSFDSSYPVRFMAEAGNPGSPTGKGATTGGNSEAWADAKIQARDYLARHLKSTP